jgi:hypothetical protein
MNARAMASELATGLMSGSARRQAAPRSVSRPVNRPVNRIVAAAVLAAVGVGLGLLWRSGDRAAAPRVVRCPIHGIAYDAELEICPDCARTREAPRGSTS